MALTLTDDSMKRERSFDAYRWLNETRTFIALKLEVDIRKSWELMKSQKLKNLKVTKGNSWKLKTLQILKLEKSEVES